MKTNMKQTNKWILSTLLVAALGSQYYYSVSSNHMHSIDMSSCAGTNATACTPEELRAEFLIKLGEVDTKTNLTTEQKTAERTRITAEYTAKMSAPITPRAQTEARIVNVPCVDCDSQGVTISGTPANVNKFVLQQAALVEAAKKTKKAKEDKEEKDEDKVETPKEKRERLAKEKKEKKDAEKQAKIQQEKDDKEERITEFEDKAEAIASKCDSDISCKTSELASLLDRYTGKKKIDQAVVSRVFNKYLDKDLRAGLRADVGSESHTAALEALENMMASVPSEYRFLKTKAVDATKAIQTSQALAINSQYKLADQYLKQKNLAQFEIAQREAFVAKNNFTQDNQMIYSSLYEGLSSSNDNATMDYVRKNLIPNYNNLVNQMTNLNGMNGITENGLSTSTTTTSTGNRGGRAGNQTVINNSGTTTSGNSLNNVRFGSPSTNRTNNRTGVNLKQ